MRLEQLCVVCMRSLGSQPSLYIADVLLDENESHAIDRYATETISCMKCETTQVQSHEVLSVDAYWDQMDC